MVWVPENWRFEKLWVTMWNYLHSYLLLKIYSLPTWQPLLCARKTTSIYCVMLSECLHVRCTYCTLNSASNWTADIPWQSGMDTDMLNTWHSAALSKCEINRAFWRGEKRKLQSRNHLSRTGPEWRWMGSRNAHIPSSPAPFFSLYLNSKGSPLAPHPWAGHMSPTSVTWVVEEAALGRPVVSVPVDNESLVSCCGTLQWSAASLSTLHGTSFPGLPWT